MSIRENGQSRALVAAGLALVALAARPAAAQAVPMDGAWSAFVGCWEPIADDVAAAAKSRVCITPSTGASAVDVVTIRDGKVANSTHLEANGAPRTIGRDGCNGTETARWSSDRMRVYLSADIVCDGVRRQTSGLMALSRTAEWIDVQGVVAAQNTGVHVARYRAVRDLTGIPAEIAQAVPASSLATNTARLAASSPIGGEAIVDASHALAAPVVEAWLLERGQGFKFDAKGLVALADAGVPGSVTDMIIALSYPKAFAINSASRDAARLPAGAVQGQNVAVTGRTIPVTAYSYSPWGWGSYYDYTYGYRYGGYGYSPYGYSPYGYGYGGGGYYAPPVIVVHAPSPTDNQPQTHPRVVNGRGYTQGASSSSSGSSSSGSSSAGSSGTSSSSGASSAGSSSGASSSSSGASSSGGERTAHRVP